MNFEIWCEGYLATGMEGVPVPAHLLGTVEADTFPDACAILAAYEGWTLKDRTVMSGGFKLFDNEESARKSFG